MIPHFAKKYWHTGLERIIGLDKKIRKVGAFKAKVRYGMEDVSRNCGGFGTAKKSGNYLRNVTTVVGLSQSKISILLLMELMDRS